MAAIANRNGRNMVQFFLLPVNIHFHWNLFIFEFLTIFLIFILAAILKRWPIWKFSKGSAVWSEFNIFSTLVTMATAAILNLFNPKSCHTLQWIFLQSFMKFNERNPKTFLFPWQLRQSLFNRFQFCWLISFH